MPFAGDAPGQAHQEMARNAPDGCRAASETTTRPGIFSSSADVGVASRVRSLPRISVAPLTRTANKFPSAAASFAVHGDEDRRVTRYTHVVRTSQLLLVSSAEFSSNRCTEARRPSRHRPSISERLTNRPCEKHNDSFLGESQRPRDGEFGTANRSEIIHGCSLDSLESSVEKGRQVVVGHYKGRHHTRVREPVHPCIATTNKVMCGRSHLEAVSSAYAHT
jgi:hypothetical protein